MAEPNGNERAPESSPFAAPQIILPKGGGAIRGIGEKFSANPVTGTGALTVPIAVSPGRIGFGPSFSLTYDSGTGNGPFAMGWNLGSPSVTRKTEKGTPTYVDEAESDVYILAGSEDLVPSLQHKHAGDWGNVEHERQGYRVKQYRPRIDGLFARIERWTRMADGDIHWRSISKENVLTVYGDCAQSRIADPAAPSHVFSWLISRSYDDRGNAIVYEYAEENGEAVDYEKASELRRTRTANRYLKRVLYGNRNPLLLDTSTESFRSSHIPAPIETGDWMFELVFDYGDEGYQCIGPDERGRVYAQISSNAQCARPVREDAFSTYRSGFEVRTYRLCLRALMYHRFPDELETDRCLVRSTEFEYLQKPTGSFLMRAIQSGYRLQAGQHYLKKSLPPLDFSYTSSPLEDADFGNYPVQEVDAGTIANIPGGIDGANYQWVDLDGEGISGVLTEQATEWFYRPNLGGGHFGPTQLVASKPSLAHMAGGRQQLLDLGGDGNLDLVDFGGSTPGFFEREPGARFSAFQTFRSLPSRNWNDPNLRFADVNGDGLADVVVTEDDAITWHASLGKDGFAEGVRVHMQHDEERGPRVMFANGTQSIYLADMSGDGKADLVRIRNGEVCYWPVTSPGRFGAKVTMDYCPWFDRRDIFDHGRIRLADTDGSGTTDIVYFGSEGARIFLNQSGNSWSEARTIRHFPPLTTQRSASVVDLLGRGTACLVWSSQLPGDSQRPLLYIDLMRGQKPHLLIKVVNNLGAETGIEYASSTEFYLADKAAGTPWVTRLPFPVHVVNRVVTFDHISRNRFVTGYSYRHGYYDGVEREFRGFGRVDQTDTEELGVLGEAAWNENAASHVPPVLTKTWFHTGAFQDGARISKQFEDEYYREGAAVRGEDELPEEDIRAMLLPDTTLPENLSDDEAREACRALKGSLLRKEVYGLDGCEASRRPYTASEVNYTVRMEQPRGANRFAVFFTHQRESLTSQYERKVYQVDGCLRADPRVSHNVTLEADEYGNLLKSVDIGYGRRHSDPSLAVRDRVRQMQTLVKLQENRYTNAVKSSDAYRAPLICETRVYELVQCTPGAHRPDATNLFHFAELAGKVTQAGDEQHDLSYEDLDAKGAVSASVYRRLLERSRTTYRSNRLDFLLDPGVLESLAILGEQFKIVFSPGLVEKIYGDKLPDVASVLGRGAGYADIDGDGHWWKPSGRVFLSPGLSDDPGLELAHAVTNFFQPQRYRDAFGQDSIIEFDVHHLAPVKQRDAVSNVAHFENDYRVLAPFQVTDANGNQSEVAFDTVGFVVGTAVMGKAGEYKGDSLTGFVADLDEAAVLAHLRNPLDEPDRILAAATTRLVYDLFAFQRSRSAAVVYTLARETHHSDLKPGERSKVQHGFSYSDGFGREIQRKVQAAPGPVTGSESPVDVRWVGAGWTVFNNKGKPVRQYEPFFTGTHHFQFDVRIGVSPVLFYDPVERSVATLQPNHTWQKLVFDPWRQESWDVNDTVLVRDPKTDPDVGGFFLRLPEMDYLPTWHTVRVSGGLGPQEQAAARKTEINADTPSVAYIDSLGRTFLTVAHNRLRYSATPADSAVEEFHATLLNFDIEGHQLAVIDALDRIVMRHDYDMLGSPIRQASMDAGERWILNDAAGQPLYAWDSRNHRFRTTYDALRRPTDSFVRESEGLELLVRRTVYGEKDPTPEVNNLRGKVVQLFDQAGVATSDVYDFKGNVLRSQRQLARVYNSTLNWADYTPLEADIYTSLTAYDALNRPTELTTPDNSVIRPGYSEANLLEQVDANLGNAQHNGRPVWTSMVTGIEYDAKGQRTQIDYGNGVRTTYEYDPVTFRLRHLLTRRNPASVLDEFPQSSAKGWPGCHLQNFYYTYDAGGNITHVCDDAQQTGFFQNKRVEPSADYTYDALYRLIEATGREHLGQIGAAPLPSSYNDFPRVGVLLSANDGNALGRYRERYVYDAAGNFETVIHRRTDPANPDWTRAYAYEEPSLLEPAKRSNRLTGTTVGTDTETYSADGDGYDPHGNMLRFPHLQIMQWDFKDQLQMTRRQSTNADAREDVTSGAERTWYVYDAGGVRVRKVTEHATGRVKDERIYLGAFEIYRAHGPNPLVRHTLHITDDKKRIALVETRTQGEDPGAPAQLTRFQLGNHLGSSTLELDEHAQTITYEEYTPYGSTSLQAVRSRTETPKRYRYLGKERDDETGFTYHGARYYAPWLGRWTAADPTGLVDGVNVFAYVSGNPANKVDLTGNFDISWTDVAIGAAAAIVVVGVVVLALRSHPCVALSSARAF